MLSYHTNIDIIYYHILFSYYRENTMQSIERILCNLFLEYYAHYTVNYRESEKSVTKREIGSNIYANTEIGSN